MKFRELPVVCITVSIYQLVIRKLRFSNKMLGRKIDLEDGEYTIFRHVFHDKKNTNKVGCNFLVSFKFSHLSHRMNQLTSIIPMLMITGFPGFLSKIYAVNEQNGNWTGIYQWSSKSHLEKYKKSFVFRTMKKRAIPDTLIMELLENDVLKEIR